ncbi:MAG TPA: SulP family inorganic anion transporter, partial [Chloroflexota bacterium]|nr:SulP family inorganic anion transporter [Chloroflexota bacterium]
MAGNTSLPRTGDELRWQRLLPAVTAGFVVGLLEVILTLSFAALIYSGPLSGFVSQGVGLALFGVILSGIIIALFTSLPGVVGGNQDVATAVLAVIAATIARSMPSGSSPEEIFLTIAVAIALTTMITGLFFWVIGYFQSGNLVRFLPYPVMGGFLAGTGWLLATGGLSMMTEIPTTLSEITMLFQPEVVWRWLPGLVFAVVLLVVSRRASHYLLLPGMVLGGILLFYLAAWLSGQSAADLLAAGWLLGPFPEGSLLQPLNYAALDQVNWPLVGEQMVNAVTICIISVLALLLNASGLEIANKQEVDLNRELRAAGAGNLAAGLVGGMVSYQQLSLSVMNIKMGANSRLTGLFTVAICGLALLLGASVLSLFPKLILGGLVLYLGLTFLVEWVGETWTKLPRTDYLVIVLI